MRAVILALFMVLATHVGAQNAQGVAEPSPTQEERHPGQAQASQPSANQFPLPIWIIEDPADTQRSRDREAASDKREAQDLDAQRKAADAADRSATAAERQELWEKFQMGLSVLGLFALLYTLHLTRQSTNSAIKMVDITERSERPLLFMKIPGEFELTEAGFDPSPEFVLCNAGKSPAEVVGIYRKWTSGIDFPPPIDPLHPPEKRDRWKKEHMIVGAGQESEPRFSDAAKLDVAKAQTDRLIFFYGYVEFEDLGGKRWATGYCMFFRKKERIFSPAWPTNVQAYKYIRELPKNSAQN